MCVFGVVGLLVRGGGGVWGGGGDFEWRWVWSFILVVGENVVGVGLVGVMYEEKMWWKLVYLGGVGGW